MPQKEVKMPSGMLDYYRRACKWPQGSVFNFEGSCTHEFLEFSGYRSVKGESWIAALEDLIDDSLVDEYSRRYVEYLGGQCRPKTASFAFCWEEFGGYIRRWIMEMGVTNNEAPSTIMDEFQRTLEFLTGIKVDRNRLVFTWSKDLERHRIDEEEVAAQAIESTVDIGVIPRPGHPHSNPWDCNDVIPLLMKDVRKRDSYFPLHYRFRIWTIIWGTGQLVRKLIDANPGFMEKAQSLGVKKYVFDDVLEAIIPAAPAIELIPIEILESVTLLKGLVSYMYDNGLIEDDAGYNLVMDGSQYSPPHPYVPSA